MIFRLPFFFAIGFAAISFGKATSESPLAEIVVQSMAGCAYTITSPQTAISIGTLVSIQNSSTFFTDYAYFLGRQKNDLLFLSADSAARRFTLTLPRALAYPANFEPLPASVVQSDSWCSPLSVLNCLKRLDQLNSLPPALQRRLKNDTEGLFQEMDREFGLAWIAETLGPWGHIYNQELDRIKQHERLVDFLLWNDVKSTPTESKNELIAHLQSGLPAVISTSYKMQVQGSNDIEQNPNLNLEWDGANFSVAPFPTAAWLRNSRGMHAVAGLGIIRGARWGRSQRIIVLDTMGNTVNVWPVASFRMSRPRFILLHPYLRNGT